MNAPEIDRAATLECADDLEAINRLYRERKWSDGLPIVPPTPERVERMLAHTKRARYDVVTHVAPAYGAATVERIAVNAVMAGCDPGYLRVLIAATEAIADPAFNLQGIQATTNPVAVWLVVNGPAATSLNVNAAFNCIGQGAWANATLGRAMRLILQNIGGALPGEMDRATQGQPGKFSFCCAENEDASPWEPLHVERGFRRDESTVTVVGAEGTLNMNTHSKDAMELVRVMAETLIHPPSNEYVHGGEPWLIIGPEHAEVFKRGGLTKDDVKRHLWEQSKMAASQLSTKELQRARDSRTEELGEIEAGTLLPISPTADEIMLIVAGGPGTHSTYVPCFGNSRAVTRPIEI
ncbi:MAG TPA: hypothetical protein VED01_07305 [Burkholderiales bacterium]|nr:hypothetical protein [Burkholderiales bacterium]